MGEYKSVLPYPGKEGSLQQRLPPSVMRALGTVAILTFLAGVCLEQAALGFLQRHPYIVNLLSGMTGFSASALVVAVLFNRAITADRAGRWKMAAKAAATASQQRILKMESLLDAPPAQPRFGEDEFAWRRERELGLRADVLTDVLLARGGFGLVLGGEMPLPKKLPFRNESATRIFLDEATTLADQLKDPLLVAFDAAGDPGVAHAAGELWSTVRGHFPNEQDKAFQAASAICELVFALRQHTNYRAYMRTWEHSGLTSLDRWLVRWRIKLRRRLPYR